MGAECRILILPPPFFWGQALQAADTSQTPPLGTTTSRRRKRMANIQFFWSKGDTSWQQLLLCRPKQKQPSSSGLSFNIQPHSPAAWITTLAMSYHSGYCFHECRGYFGTCQGERGWNQQEENTSCCFRYICISLATTLLTLGISNIETRSSTYQN